MEDISGFVWSYTPEGLKKKGQGIPLCKIKVLMNCNVVLTVTKNKDFCLAQLGLPQLHWNTKIIDAIKLKGRVDLKKY